MVQQAEDRVYFEASLPSESGRSMFAADEFLSADNLDQFTPQRGMANQAARTLQSLEFRIQAHWDLLG